MTSIATNKISSLKLERRLRRNRISKSIRSLVQESRLHPSDFVAPFFLLNGLNKKESIHSMPGVFKYSVDLLIKEAEKLHRKGVLTLALFPVISPENKDGYGSEALNPNGIVPKAIQVIKKELPEMTIIADAALDPYTNHGHDGLLDEQGYVDNDATVEKLCEQAILAAEFGVDIVAPSDMMDGRVAAIRQALDSKGFINVAIMSYTAKFSSSLYKGFRDALGSTLTSVDKLSYQLSPTNSREALLEAKEDIKEGADMLLVKPGSFYLDVLTKIKDFSDIPVGAYQVSGEYSLIMAADKLGYINGLDTLLESLTCIKRAGADFIFSYALDNLLIKNSLI